MEFESLLLRFLHYTDTKMSLSTEELKNDGLGHNKHMINERILLGWALEGRVGRMTKCEILLMVLGNRIWDAHTQKGTKRKFSRGSLQRKTSRSARQCKFHIFTIKAPQVARASLCYYLLGKST